MALDDIFYGSGILVTNIIEEIPTGILNAPIDITFGISGSYAVFELTLYTEKISISSN